MKRKTFLQATAAMLATPLAFVGSAESGTKKKIENGVTKGKPEFPKLSEDIAFDNHGNEIFMGHNKPHLVKDGSIHFSPNGTMSKKINGKWKVIGEVTDEGIDS